MGGRRRVWRWGLLAFGGLLVLTLLAWVAVELDLDPFRAFTTADRYVKLVDAERFEEAKAMIAPEDRGRIPNEYWEQFRGRTFDVTTAPHHLTPFNGKMAMRLWLDGETDSGILYYIDGRIVRAHAIHESFRK